MSCIHRFFLINLSLGFFSWWLLVQIRFVFLFYYFYLNKLRIWIPLRSRPPRMRPTWYDCTAPFIQTLKDDSLKVSCKYLKFHRRPYPSDRSTSMRALPTTWDRNKYGASTFPGEQFHMEIIHVKLCYLERFWIGTFHWAPA